MKKQALLFALLLATFGTAASAASRGGASALEAAQRSAELNIRNLVEPILDKYCHDECKLLGVSAAIDIASPDQVAPGFDDVDPRSASALAPSAATIKLLMDDKIGPVSRTKLLDLIQQYLDTLDYPVKVAVQSARFPQPQGSAGKIAELRERVTRRFRETVDGLFNQFCREQCLLADYELQTEVVNAEEAQYGASGEFVEDGGVAVRIKNIKGTILVDDTLSPEERTNIVEMAKLKTNYFRNVDLASKSLRFPRPGQLDSGAFLSAGGGAREGMFRGPASKSSTESKNESSSNSAFNSTKNDTSKSSNQSTSNETNAKQERFERFEKIERVESGDAVQAELKRLAFYGLIFAVSCLSLLIFVAMAAMRPSGGGASSLQRIIQQVASDPVSTSAPSTYNPGAGISGSDERAALISKRYEIERLRDELLEIYAQNPKVAKQVFSRVLTEEGVETTAQYIHIFGESVVMDMLRDPSLQADLQELMEFYAKNPMELTDDERHELLKKLHNRTVAGKMVLMGSRTSNSFDFLADMDGLQIMELIRNESLTVKSIILTQCESQKRAAIFSQLDADSRMKLMNELSRIDYLPRDYIYNVATSLKRKRRENPKLNTEALPGSEVLLTLLERTNSSTQRQVVKGLEVSNPDSARTLKSKLVSLDTLRFLRDGQLLEVVLSLRHDELLQFLKGSPESIRESIFAKAPKELTIELEEELGAIALLNRESYVGLERKVINRMKIMANEGLINLLETNERMMADAGAAASIIEAGPDLTGERSGTGTDVKKVAGW